MMQCDPETGACLLPETEPLTNIPSVEARNRVVIRYIGDPMCSWCWGISPTVTALAKICDEEGIAFSATMGGLRAGGGDAWTSSFKGFLRNEWTHIASATGQPFGFTLLDESHFNYDTEPACRAVVTAQQLLSGKDHAALNAATFFSEVQRKFYVDGKDPKQIDFYGAICQKIDLDFDAFKTLFESAEAKQLTKQEFDKCRLWGVRSFPTLLIERHKQINLLAVGYVTFDQLLEKIRRTLKT